MALKENQTVTQCWALSQKPGFLKKPGFSFFRSTLSFH
jgi:hypothetical protein